MQKTGIIIRTFNEEEMLPKTLSALMKQSDKNFEIIVIDSGSTDSTVEILKKCTNIRLIEIKNTDFTYGKALNIGISALPYDTKYIALLSAHAIPYNDEWLHTLIKPMEDNQLIEGVYGKQIPWPEHLSNPIVKILATTVYPLYYGDSPIITNTSSFFSNANCAIRYHAWQKHPYDEKLYASEDQAWGKAIIHAGGYLAYQPEAPVYHSHPDTYYGYYLRRKREEAGIKTIDPENHPKITREELIFKLASLIKSYGRNCILSHSFKGYHLDHLLYLLINLFATYHGINDAK